MAAGPPLAPQHSVRGGAAQQLPQGTWTGSCCPGAEAEEVRGSRRANAPRACILLWPTRRVPQADNSKQLGWACLEEVMRFQKEVRLSRFGPAVRVADLACRSGAPASMCPCAAA
jgi:hypothetical protein